MILAFLRSSAKSRAWPRIALPASARKLTTATWKVDRSRQNAEFVREGDAVVDGAFEAGEVCGAAAVDGVPEFEQPAATSAAAAASMCVRGVVMIQPYA